MHKLSLFLTRTLRRLVAGCFAATGKEGAEASGIFQNCLIPVGRSEAPDALLARIVCLMEVEKLFKDPHLDLKQLSERLETPAYLVTRAINESLRVNFNDFVNRYRVEEVKNLLVLRDCRKFTLMSIASDAGFNSKTTFNTVFKKVTGMTPSYFRDRHCRSVKQPIHSYKFAMADRV